MFLAGNMQLDRFGTRGDQYVFGSKQCIADLDGARPGKKGSTVIGIDTFFAIPLFMPGRHRVRKALFESHQFGPVDRDVSGHALALHPTNMVGGIHTADQHLFGITTTQCTGPAERAEIDDRNAPTGSTDLHGGDHRGCSGTYHDKVVSLLHDAFSRR